ncbi:AMP-binding protein [Roseovarius aestuarii]|uniref:4-chlorobenzoate--CoA ligase n=1 Tax=Roseovarius aestuarii TaxID=475083 RepID=A0A1X7BYF9_9RHOB|nr:AMP-binding protein [Roseovarius aestuarii]SMC14309.1 4-chlorobenzoate--CoA ligase [Roseovarius aestuarii]
MANLLDQFATAVDRHPDRIAIVDGKGREISFKQLQKRAQGFAAKWHDKGIRPGDRVLLAMPVNADLYASLAALWSLGATVVLPEPAMGLAGLRHAARVTRPKAFCASGVYAPLKFLVPELWALRLLLPRGARVDQPVKTVRDNDTALISFTSGTTGLPKAIPRSHGFLMAQHDAIAPLLDSTEAERDLVAFPVFTLINLAAGRTTILPNWKMTRLHKLAPALLSAWITQQKATRLLIPPSLCEKLALCGQTEPLHTVFTGGGPVFPDLVDKLRRKTDLDVICVYGSTEAEPIAHLDARDISVEDQHWMKVGKGLLVGHPVPQIKLRILDDEVQVAGPHVNDGYLDPAHAKDNKIIDGPTTWHRTGDAGALDDQGRLWLWGRLGSDVTSDSGRIFPFTVEVTARHWPGIEQSALVRLNGHPALCIQGDPEYQPTWEKLARDIGVPRVISVQKIPLDRRHRSKVDRRQLMRLLDG